MSITPVGGWGQPQQPQQPQEEQPITLSTANACPSCHSTDWRAASLIYAEGLSLSKSKTKGSAVGVSRTGLKHGQWQVGTAQYSGNTRGVSQTVLSSMASPPKEQSGLKIGLFIMFVLCAISSLAHMQSDTIALGIVLGLAAVVFLVFLGVVIRQQKETFKQAMELYMTTKVCMRCGTFYNN